MILSLTNDTQWGRYRPYCVYVGIGQKKSSILNIQTLLQNNKASHYTTIVAATAAQSASLQFIAPYTGCAMPNFIVIKVNML